jgi:hypothetical protein
MASSAMLAALMYAFQVRIQIVVAGQGMELPAVLVQLHPAAAPSHEVILDTHREDGIHAGEGVDHEPHRPRFLGRDTRVLSFSTECLGVQMVRRYRRDGSLFRDNSAGKLGL